jgi:hypothetical protein
MRIRTTLALACLLGLGCGPALAQTGIVGLPSPLGITSPLGIGPGSSVGSVGIPMGATELATPGLSPATSDINASPCSTTAGSNAPFDGSANTGATASACAAMGSAQGQLRPSVSSLATTGRAQIPLGATELSPGGLSPLPLVLPPNPSVSLAPSVSSPSLMGQNMSNSSTLGGLMGQTTSNSSTLGTSMGQTTSTSSTFGRSMPSSGR